MHDYSECIIKLGQLQKTIYKNFINHMMYENFTVLDEMMLELRKIRASINDMMDKQQSSK